MDELISRKAVLALPIYNEKNLYGNIIREYVDIEDVKQLPSAEPDIIRCKDCKNWDTTWTNDFSPNYHYCPMVDGVRKGDWFCADAERREVDNERK